MTRVLGFAAAASVALAAISLPATAAPPGAERQVQSATLTVLFRAKAPAGYRFWVQGVAPRLVTVTVSKGGASTNYTVKGTVSADGLDARLGRFGRVSVEFQPTAKPQSEKPFPGCKGEPEVVTKGVFTGTIRFRGERGYTRIGASRGSGYVWKSPRQVCGGGPGSFPGGGGGSLVELQANCGTHGFAALGDRSRDKGRGVFPDDRGSSIFYAYSSETRGRIEVTRIGFATGGQDAFSFDEALSAATVKPPPPFHGSASFARDANGDGVWSGSLGVSFPGRDMALAGPGFGSELRRLNFDDTMGAVHSDDPACGGKGRTGSP